MHNGRFARRAFALFFVTSLLVAAAPVALHAQTPASSAVVFPEPGTQTASPTTTISFRHVAPARVGAVAVIGEQSGPHPGTWLAHTDRNGVSFVPAKPFSPGERVTVRTALAVRGAVDGVFGFTVARPGRELSIQSELDPEVLPSPIGRLVVHRDRGRAMRRAHDVRGPGDGAL